MALWVVGFDAENDGFIGIIRRYDGDAAWLLADGDDIVAVDARILVEK